ncbi:MAG: hypothetical protein QW153_01750 [Candidatus Bilamarchaeaceae archaeon]
MKLRDVLIASALVIVLFIAYSAFTYISTVPAEQKEAKNISFSIKKIDRAGDYAYVVYSLNGNANITLLGYEVYAPQKITVIKDDEGMDSERVPELFEKIKNLEDYGYSLTLSERRTLNKGINIVATGAMPNYIIDAIRANESEGVVIYIGKKDRALRSGSIIEEKWYEQLDEEQKKRIIVYNGTLATFLNEGLENKMMDDILKNAWANENVKTFSIEGDGSINTKIIKINQSKYIRVIYEIGRKKGVVDSSKLPPPPNIILKPEPETIYPWQTSILEYKIEKSNGTAYFSIYKNQMETQAERLRRVVDGSYFHETLTQKEPGYYILIVSDNSGMIGSGILHVANLDIKYSSKVYNTYYFNVTVDGEPLESTVVYATLNEGQEKRKYYVSNGQLAINALLRKGENIFNIEIEGKKYNIKVINTQESIWDFYLTYGVPAFLIVLAVYAFARFSRKAAYTLRISEGGREIRNEIKVSETEVLEAIRKIEKDAKLKDYPITTAEFEIALKRYITQGAEVTEGNVVEILRRLVKKGKIENYGEYWQIVGKGDIKEKAILRQIREKLIENGVAFKELKRGFATKDYDIVLRGEKWRNKRTIVVFENEDEIREIEGTTGPEERAKIKIKQANNLLVFTTLNNLSKYIQ